MIDREKIYKIYDKIENLIVPSLKHSQYFYKEILANYLGKDFNWLDLGCGHQVLPRWCCSIEEEEHLISKCNIVVGLDYDLHSLLNHRTITCKVRGNISQVPCKNNTFDLITSNMVVEHLDKPYEQFKEICRVLKPQGLFIFHTPNIHGYTTGASILIPEVLKTRLIYILQGRKEEDIFKTYYRANSPSKIRSLGKLTGFIIEEIKMVATSAQFIFPPIVILELLLIKLLMTKSLRMLRPNIIAVLRKDKKHLKIVS